MLNENNRHLAAFRLQLIGPGLIWFNSLSNDIRDARTSLKSVVNFHCVKKDMFDSRVPYLIVSTLVLSEDYHSKIPDKRLRLQKRERI